MFLSGCIQLNSGPFDRVSVRERSVIPDSEARIGPFDVVEIASIGPSGDFSKLEIFVKEGRGPALADALKKAIES
jgi:hypothetical protein